MKIIVSPHYYYARIYKNTSGAVETLFLPYGLAVQTFYSLKEATDGK